MPSRVKTPSTLPEPTWARTVPGQAPDKPYPTPNKAGPIKPIRLRGLRNTLTGSPPMVLPPAIPRIFIP